MGAFTTHAALLIAIGVCGYIAALHLALSRRGERPHKWVVAWCVGSLVFQIARYVQLHTSTVETAVFSARIYAAMGPLLIWALVGFARALKPQARFGGAMGGYTATSLLLALGIAFTDWFVPGHTSIETDWFGMEYIGVPAASAMLILGPLIAAGLAYGTWQLMEAPGLKPGDRWRMVAALSVYAAMGVFSVLSSADVVPLPGLAEFGPVVVCVGFNQLLVRRHVRTRDQLEEAVALRTTDLEESHQQVADREAHFRTLFDHVPTAVSVWTLEGELLSMNRTARALAAHDDAEPEMDDFGRATLERSGITGLMRRAAAGGSAVHAEVHLETRAEPLDLLVTAVPIRQTPEARVSAVMLICEDLRDRRSLEDALRHSHKIEALGRLAAGIAHEINNPLAFVRSNLNMLRSEWAGLASAIGKLDAEDVPEGAGELEELIDDCSAGVDRALAIVGDIKQYAHDAPTLPSPCDVNELVADCVRVASIRRHPGVQVEEAYEAGLSPVVCEANRLRQAVVNLVSNAFDSVGESGSVRIATRRGAQWLAIVVEDDGCGMDEATRERILEPFFTTKAPGAGTGLGLYVTQGIVRAHRGLLRIDSEPGRGSRFEIALPLQPTEG